MSIPTVSDREKRLIYHFEMTKNGWDSWGMRLRVMAKDNGFSLAKLAEKLDRSESTLRSWTNGTREINLSEFFELCDAAQVNPSQVLFGGVPMDSEIMRQVGELAKRVLDADPASVPDYQKLAARLRTKPKIK